MRVIEVARLAGSERLDLGRSLEWGTLSALEVASLESSWSSSADDEFEVEEEESPSSNSSGSFLLEGDMVFFVEPGTASFILSLLVRDLAFLLSTAVFFKG